MTGLGHAAVQERPLPHRFLRDVRSSADIRDGPSPNASRKFAEVRVLLSYRRRAFSARGTPGDVSLSARGGSRTPRPHPPRPPSPGISAPSRASNATPRRGRRHEATLHAVAQGRSRPAPARDTRRRVARWIINTTGPAMGLRGAVEGRQVLRHARRGAGVSRRSPAIGRPVLACDHEGWSGARSAGDPKPATEPRGR